MHGSTQANMECMALVLFGPVILGDTKLQVVIIGEESPIACSEYLPLHRWSEENVWWWLISSWTQRNKHVVYIHHINVHKQDEKTRQ